LHTAVLPRYIRIAGALFGQFPETPAIFASCEIRGAQFFRREILPKVANSNFFAL